MKPDDPRDLLRRLASITLAIVAACSVTGWAHTAHELNALVAYQPVGGSAADLARLLRGDYDKYARLIKELAIKLD